MTDLHLDCRAERAADEVVHALEQSPDVDRAHLQILAPGEGRAAAAPASRRGWPPAAASISRCDASFAGKRRRSRSRLPMIGVSRLLKSWATPPVSWPSVSSFCASWSLASAARGRAVRSSTRASSVSFALRSRSSLS